MAGRNGEVLVRVAVWHGKQEMPVARARTLGVGWCGRKIFAIAMCQLQFAKASATMLSQQEKNDTADVQRERVNISGFIGTVTS